MVETPPELSDRSDVSLPAGRGLQELQMAEVLATLRGVDNNTMQVWLRTLVSIESIRQSLLKARH